MQELIQADDLQGGSEVVDFQPSKKILQPKMDKLTRGMQNSTFGNISVLNLTIKNPCLGPTKVSSLTATVENITNLSSHLKNIRAQCYVKHSWQHCKAPSSGQPSLKRYIVKI